MCIRQNIAEDYCGDMTADLKLMACVIAGLEMSCSSPVIGILTPQ